MKAEYKYSDPGRDLKAEIPGENCSFTKTE